MILGSQKFTVAQARVPARQTESPRHGTYSSSFVGQQARAHFVVDRRDHRTYIVDELINRRISQSRKTRLRMPLSPQEIQFLGGVFEPSCRQCTVRVFRFM